MTSAIIDTRREDEKDDTPVIITRGLLLQLLRRATAHYDAEIAEHIEKEVIKSIVVDEKRKVFIVGN